MHVHVHVHVWGNSLPGPMGTSRWATCACTCACACVGELTTRAYGNIKVGYMCMYMCMCMCGGTHYQGLWEHQGGLHVHVHVHVHVRGNSLPGPMGTSRWATCTCACACACTGELTTRAYGNIKVGYMYMCMCMCMYGGAHYQGLWEHQDGLHVHVHIRGDSLLQHMGLATYMYITCLLTYPHVLTMSTPTGSYRQTHGGPHVGRGGPPV